MKSDKFSIRKAEPVLSPSANMTLSMILLFPDPFGPETVVNPFNKGISDLLANDLKLSISNCFMYIIYPSLVCFTIMADKERSCQKY